MGVYMAESTSIEWCDATFNPWWVRMEGLGLASKADGALFRNDRPSYSQMLKFSSEQRDMFDNDEEALACFCGE